MRCYIVHEEVTDMLRYKVDVLKELKDAGYNPGKIRREVLLSESTMSAIRRGVIVRPDSLDKLCGLLGCQPGMLIEWVPDKKYDKKDE